MATTDAAFLAAVSDARNADAAWTALAALADAVAGHRLFTVTLVDTPAGLVRRAYSSRPQDYPTSGTKPLRGNAGDWFENVFVQRGTFVANTLAEIAKVFPDHALIGSLGCGSVVRALTDAAWTALAALADAVAGHRLFTVTLVDTPAGLVRRAYSSRPGDYPTSGTKPLRGNTGNWFEHVFVQRRTFVANTLAEIAEVFPDHALIGSLGCGSVVNMPIVLKDELVATVNLLDAEDHYTPDRVAAAEDRLALPARLCIALAWSLEPSGIAA